MIWYLIFLSLMKNDKFAVFSGEDAKLALPETGLAVIPGYVSNLRQNVK